MNFCLNALTGAQITLLSCLLSLIALQCIMIVFLICQIIRVSRRKKLKGAEATVFFQPSPVADEKAIADAEAPAVSAPPEPQPAVEQPAEAAETEAAEEQSAEAAEEAPIAVEEQPAEEKPVEADQDKVYAERAAAAAVLTVPLEESADTAEEAPTAVEEQPAEEVQPEAVEPAEATETEAAEEQPVHEIPEESTAETVEEILEEHGLTSAEEITEEIAEEIMSVSTHHDEEAEEIVVVEGLYKKYSKKADYAVSNVNFRCYEGEIVGLLGHNGAGKSTTLKCLEGMLPFDQGKISICGKDIVKDPIAAKANMGFVTDNHATFIKMTGMQYLSFMADVYGVPGDVRKERIDKLEEIFQLGPAINNLISSYSHGMRQKVCMMGSLMHMPKLWVLDEPMTGLDPRTTHAVQQFMREYADAGNCIIFSSHALITVARMCDRLVLLRTGQQLDELNIKRLMTVDPNFDFEEYFLKHEGQD